jgi:hypothetical protein
MLEDGSFLAEAEARIEGASQRLPHQVANCGGTPTHTGQHESPMENEVLPMNVHNPSVGLLPEII